MPKYDEDGNIIEASEDDDILDELFIDGTTDDNDDSGNVLDPEELKSLKGALAEKDKQINGLLQTVKADRRKRQEMKGQLDQVTTTINSVLAQREELDKQLEEGSRSGTKSDINGIPVEFNDDGDAFVPTEKLEALTQPYEQKIQDLEEALLLTNNTARAEAEAQRAIQQMVGEDERYAPVYSKYQNARKWVNDRVIEFQTDNNINGEFTSGQAMTHVFGDGNLAQEFTERYPEFDLAQVATAEDSEWHFRTMLKTTAGKAGDLKEPDERFRKVIRKPSGLGKSSNAKAGELSLAERVASLSATDIALQKYMKEDEQSDGIKF
jgi:hypothetical protein